MSAGTTMDRTAADLSGSDWFKDENVQTIIGLLNADGGEARIVGGAVRNALMGLAIGDVDIATTLLPDEVMARAEKAGIKTIPTGIDHGTVTLVRNGHPFEVTTLRTDMETDGRRADVVFGTDWAEDAARRDFTINALYLDAQGKVIDLVDGLNDIETKTIRFIGDADLRNSEDYLRILRFFRFFAWYGEGRPDADGLRSAARLKAGLEKLSAERVWMELKKLLSAEDPSRSLLWMRQTGVLTAVLPETEKWGIDAIAPLIHAEEVFGWDADPLLRIMAMVPPDPDRVAAMAKRLRLSRAESRRLVGWARTQPVKHDIGDMAFNRVLYGCDLASMRDWLRLALSAARQRARSDTNALAEAAGYSRLIARLDKWKRPAFPLNGDDLKEVGLEAGPELGALQKTLEGLWLESNFTMTRDDLLFEAVARSQQSQS
ncbi:CCA tRNA nucleotidyltransferase [Pararhizobium haloflavum]|uniref:CCA tRNA nucleotidyltransferase n=1 Tax=Pararhizobium haloflavum TaxID=2037914 RepID=UPI001FE03929|nr:CCA tRNA nucleotidyltransferase [Pararhizobium haloflavum]